MARPTMEEWLEPLTYIESLRSKWQGAALVRVVPPQGWGPPCALDKDSFSFPTRVQAVHHLHGHGSTGGTLRHPQPQTKDEARFFAAVSTALGRPLKKQPMFNGRELDLLHLHHAVTQRGGYEAVTTNKGWQSVGQEILQVSPCTGVVPCRAGHPQAEGMQVDCTAVQFSD